MQRFPCCLHWLTWLRGSFQSSCCLRRRRRRSRRRISRRRRRSRRRRIRRRRRRKAQARGPLEARLLLAGLKELHLEQFEFVAGSWILVEQLVGKFKLILFVCFIQIHFHLPGHLKWHLRFRLKRLLNGFISGENLPRHILRASCMTAFHQLSVIA